MLASLVRRTVAALAILALPACAYTAPVAVSPNLNVYVASGERLPGRWLIYADGAALKKDVKATGLSCSAHRYPLDISDAFRQSAVRTLQNLVEDAVLVAAPPPVESARAQGAVGVIVLKAESLNARFVAVANFFDATIDANVDITASITADTGDGRVLATTAEGDGNAQSGSGGACEGAATAIGQASEAALKEVLGTLAERFANAPRLQESARSRRP